MPCSAINALVLAMASWTVRPLSVSVEFTPSRGEFMTVPSLASKLSWLTSAPSMSGTMGSWKWRAKA